MSVCFLAVCLSVCLSVCFSVRSHFVDDVMFSCSGAHPCGSKEPSIRWGYRFHTKSGTFEGAKDSDAAFCQITLDTCCIVHSLELACYIWLMIVLFGSPVRTITLAASVRPSVRPSVCPIFFLILIGCAAPYTTGLTRGQHATRPAYISKYYKNGHTYLFFAVTWGLVFGETQVHRIHEPRGWVQSIQFVCIQ